MIVNQLFQSGELGPRFLVTLIFVSLLIIIASNKKSSPKHNTYTYFVISIVVFFLCFSLNKIDLNLGMALGLFAIFGIIRYRTETIKAQEMTYLFAFIGLAVINALAPFNPENELIVINGIITISILAAQNILLDRDLEAEKKEGSFKTVITLPYQDNEVTELDIKLDFERKFQKSIKRVELSRIDHRNDQITYIIYY
jgi:hypothetical protein